jgi:hypothetical protein
MRWRSKTGWNVIAGFNDILDFTEAGTARVATIVAGNYATTNAYAAAVATAMSTAPSHSNTYTIQYDTSTHKFAVSRSTGSAALVLKVTDGANLAVTAWDDLGFTANKTGDTVYIADLASYHSKEYVKIDLVSTPSIAVVILFDHNFTSAGVVTAQANSIDDFVPPDFQQAVTGDTSIRILFPDSAIAGMRYWRLVIKDQGNTTGYSEFGVPFLGSYLQPANSYDQGYATGPKSYSAIARADHGAVFVDRRQRAKVYTLQWPLLSQSDSDAFDAMDAAVSVGGPFFFHADPTNRPLLTYYMTLTAPIMQTQGPGDGPNFERFKPQTIMEEALG